MLAYDEPPTWYYPVRETLGAALLAHGEAAEAEQVFREDLRYNPRNGRSLFGVWKSSRRRDETTDAARAAAEFRRVWGVADVVLTIDRSEAQLVNRHGLITKITKITKTTKTSW